jgi:hypothetical protein
VISAQWRLPVALTLLASGLVGCATPAPPAHDWGAPASIAHAYQQGVRDAHAQLVGETAADIRATWTAPVVQEVWIPAQVVNGVFLPGHREWVVIHPAEWQRSSPLPGRSAPAGAAPNDRRRP